MIVEKIFKCCTLYSGYRETEEIILALANELKDGYHITSIERQLNLSINTIVTEPDLIITLRKEL